MLERKNYDIYPSLSDGNFLVRFSKEFSSSFMEDENEWADNWLVIVIRINIINFDNQCNTKSLIKIAFIEVWD